MQLHRRKGTAGMKFGDIVDNLDDMNGKVIYVEENGDYIIKWDNGDIMSYRADVNWYEPEDPDA
jgi:hypothetical protein